MSGPALLAGLLTLVSPASAAAPYASDAAAVAAFFASSVTLTSVAVSDVDGPSPVAAGVTHALRAELFRLGVGVAKPNAEADFELRGTLLFEPGRTTWLSSLWRKADGRLAATYDRALGPSQTAESREAPAAPEAARRPAAAARRRAWSLSGGPHFRSETIGWLAGVLWACPTGRWEAGLDVGNYGSDKETTNPGVGTLNRTEIWHGRLRANRLLPVAGNAFFDGWLPSSAVLRGGLGVSLLHMQEKVIIKGIPPVHFTREKGYRVYLRPVFDVGVRLKLTRRLAADLGLEWVPDLFGPGNVNRGGFAASTRLQF